MIDGIGGYNYSKTTDEIIELIQQALKEQKEEIIDKVWSLAYKAVRYPDDYSLEEFEKDMDKLKNMTSKQLKKRLKELTQIKMPASNKKKFVKSLK